MIIKQIKFDENCLFKMQGFDSELRLVFYG